MHGRTLNHFHFSGEPAKGWITAGTSCSSLALLPSVLCTAARGNFLECWLYIHMCEHAKSPQSCLTLCDHMNYSLPGSSVMGISRQEYWSGLSCPLPGDLPNPGTEPISVISPALAGGFFTTSATWEAPYIHISSIKMSGRRCANLLTVAAFGGRDGRRSV